ncbi:MAG: tRNA lysidine(34) synthetase TilS [Gemmatimonadota bacterium]
MPLPLERRFVSNLRDLLADCPDEVPHLLVAFSGGLDSTLLLYLLRFQAGEVGVTLSAAHFDHRMRHGSSADASWARGICEAWEIPFDTAGAAAAISNEQGARRARYAFLRERAARLGADFIVTAHHADDQAETVLFRALRGTGVAGLRGIAARTRGGLLRPLLPFWRSEIEELAARRGLRWRVDPTNEMLGPVRNRIRHQLLPQIEREIAPGASRSLVRLAELARESEAGYDAAIASHWSRAVRYEEGTAILAREELRRYHPALATRIVRKVLRRFGTVPGRIGTRSALQFITDATSGRTMQMPGGVRIRTEFDQARIERDANQLEDDPLRIGRLELGEFLSGSVRLGGCALTVEAKVTTAGGAGSDENGVWRIAIPLSAVRFPLLLRARRSGDRIRTSGGSKSLKKLMIERRIPLAERSRRPILQDDAGAVLWAVGITSGAVPSPTGSEPVFHLTVYR